MTAFLPDASPSLVGRDREQDALRRHMATVLAGHGSLVLIGGEAGIGKTSLAEALCRDAARDGAMVLIGRCYDLTETPPYGPWIDLFARSQFADGVALPDAFARRDTVGAVASQAALFQQALDFFTALAEARPLVLLLDDLHWADPASLDLLRFLARSVAAMPLLILATYRADELTRRHPLYQLLPTLVREAHADRLDLQRIEEADIRALVAARYALPSGDTARLMAYLHARSEGNPFFLGELLRTLEAERILRRGDGWALGNLTQTRVPALLRQVIDGRLARLGEEAYRLLAVAAVIGQEVPLALWSAVAEIDEGSVVSVVEHVIEAHIMDESPDGAQVRFAHALIREALYESILPTRRRALHRHVAEMLTVPANPEPDAVAHHFRQAGDARAREWIVRAGDRAKRAYAWLTATDRYEAALALMERDGTQGSERGWLLYRLSQTLLYNDPQRGHAYLNVAIHDAAISDDHPLWAIAIFNRGFLCCLAGDYRRGLADLETGGAALEALSATEQERVRQQDAATQGVRPALVFWLAILGRYAEAIAMGERASEGYHGLHIAYAAMGRPDDADRVFRHLCGIYYHPAGEHSNELGSLILEHISFVTLPYHATNLAERTRLVEDGEQTYQLAGGSWPVSPSGWARMPLLLVEGAWDEAERAALIWRASGRSGTITALRILGPLARSRGEPGTAWAWVHEGIPAGLATVPGEARLLDTLILQRVAATLAMDAGDLPTSRSWLEAHDRWLTWSGAVLGRAECALGWAAYHRAAGDPARALQHANQALTHATEPRQPLALLAAHRLLGELATDAGHYGDATTHLDAALALADACAVPFERALTLLALAELHAATGKRSEAATLLDEVRTICTPLGAKPTLARADALAARLAAIKDAPPASPAGLSAREVEVLRLVAAGRSNRDIADALFLSPGTVNIHVTHILTKTNSANRTEAAAFAHRHGLA